MKPVKDWRQSYRWYSIWASTATVLLTLAAIVQSLLPIWQPVLDADTYKYLVAITGTLTIAARLIDQGTNNEQDQ